MAKQLTPGQMRATNILTPAQKAATQKFKKANPDAWKSLDTSYQAPAAPAAPYSPSPRKK